MKEPEKYNVVIIEDFQSDYKFMYSALAEFYQIKPDNEEDWENLRTQIVSLYSEGNRLDETRASRKYIKAQLEKYKGNLFIIDYLLMEDNESCNGIRFCEEFVHNSVVLIITKSPEDDDNEMKNEIADFCESGMNNNKIYQMYKEPFKHPFMVKFIKKVKKILPPEKLDESNTDKPLNLDNIS